MYIDGELQLSSAQDITGSAASENYIDLSVASRDFGKGRPLFLVVTVSEDFDSGADDGTLTITLQKDTATTFGSPTTVLATQAYAEAALTAGREPIVIPIPPGLDERYVRAYYTVAGSGNFTAGTVDACIVADVQTNIHG